MVKVDVKRDYYADLELRPDASTEDIKKQFRTLARLYHPDRNPGKEHEYVPKFQAIQAAHEILTDATQRAKYDADRKKYGYSSVFPRPAVPTGNPYKAYSNFPPPPRRAPQPQPRPTFTSTPSSGADRFRDFPKPPPRTPRTGARDDAEARASNFNAWQNMNARARPASQQKPAPPPRHHSGNAASDSEDTHQTGPSAYASFGSAKPGMGRSNTARTPRKPTGFDPAALGADEPQATGASAYFTSSRYGNVPPPPPREANSPMPPKPDPLSRFRSRGGDEVPFAEGSPRVSTPYTSHGGEKTYVSSEALHRTGSARDPGRQRDSFGHDAPSDNRPRSNSARHRSTSPMPRKPTASTANTRAQADGSANKEFFMYSSSDESETDLRRYRSEPQPATSKPPPSPTRPNGTNGLNVEDPMSNGMGQKSNSTMYDQPFSTTHFPSSTSQPSTPWSQKWPFGNVRAGKCTARPPDWAFPASVTPPKVTPAKRKDSLDSPTTNPKPGAPWLMQLISSEKWLPVMKEAEGLRELKELQEFFGRHFPSLVANGLATVFFEKDKANSAFTTSFNFPNHSSFAADPGFKSRSTENINTKFSPGEWNGKFEGNPDYFARPPSAQRNGSNSRTSPTRGRPSNRPRAETHQPYATPQTNGSSQTSFFPPPPPFPPPPTTSPPNHNPGGFIPPLPGKVKFSAEEWQKTLKEPSFLYPSAKPPSPTRAASAPKRTKTPVSRRGSKGSIKTAPPKPALVSETIDESELGNKTAGQPPAPAADGNAMDIDMEDIPPATASPTTARGPRLVPVPPSRKEWQDTSTASPTQLPPPPPPPPPPPQPAPDTTTPLGLHDLNNVAPLALTRAGLADLADLHTTLPFESRASPTTHPLTPRTLILPPPPKPPPLPAPSTRLTPTTWHAYLTHMQAYMREWARFNGAMVGHFAARQGACERLVAGGSAVLGAVGDTSAAGKGWGSYLRGVREDERVRAHWNVAAERHREAMEGFVGVRERVLRGGLVGE